MAYAVYSTWPRSSRLDGVRSGVNDCDLCEAARIRWFHKTSVLDAMRDCACDGVWKSTTMAPHYVNPSCTPAATVVQAHFEFEHYF